MAVFGQKKNQDSSTPVSEMPVAASQSSVIGKTLLIKGEVFSEDEILIEGKIQGTINVKNRVIIGKNGNVEADIDAREVVIKGKVIGNVKGVQAGGNRPCRRARMATLIHRGWSSLTAGYSKAILKCMVAMKKTRAGKKFRPLPSKRLKIVNITALIQKTRSNGLSHKGRGAAALLVPAAGNRAEAGRREHGPGRIFVPALP